MGKLSKENIRILKTCNLYFCFFTLGMSIAIAGPCLLDLERIVKTDMKHIALMYTARSTGVVLGAVCGGIVLDFIKSKLAAMAICKLLVAVTMIGIPWSRNFEFLLGFMIVNGLCLGTLELGCNVVCLTLWGEKSGPIFQGLHFTFGLGGFVAPLIAAPFLGDYIESDVYSSYSDAYLNETSWNATSSSLINKTMITLKESKIVYPFSVIGICGIVVAIVFVFICFASSTEQGETDNKKETSSNRSLLFMVPVVIFNFMLIFTQAGTEIGYGQMLTTYAVKGRLRLSATTGSYMTSAFWASFMTSRLASVFLAARFSCLTLIIGDIIVISGAALVLLFLMPREWVLWMASVIYGIGVASFYPTAIGWISTHIVVTNKLGSIFTVGAATGEMVVPFVISFFIESVPEIFTYVVAGSCVSAYFLVFIMYMIFRHSGTDTPKESDNIRMRTISITA